MSETKLLGDYLEELVNGWCPHGEIRDGLVQALRCPRCVGDALDEATKRAQAEMLAAVLAKMDGPKMSHDDLYRAIQKLQPAAKYPEELLREEREKGWGEALEATQCTIAASGLDDDGVNHILSRIRSLRKEKARASEGEG